MRAVKEMAYAKINLYIDVIGKRDDGFHAISTVMHSVSLCDEVTVTLNSLGNENIRMVLDGNRRLPTDSKNLAVSAAAMFLSRAGIKADITIKLNKKIPIAAGLAGGSTDAAATLRALNKLFSRTFAERALLSMAAELGSDVPYCLLSGTALCEGRGEIITRLPSALKLHTVIAVATEHVSTPKAYALLDAKYTDFKEPRATDAKAAILDGAKSGVMPSGELYNIFEGVILPECPGAAKIKQAMLLFGATHAMMSGSGPSVFGVFDSKDKAERACTELESLGFTAYYATSV